MDMMENGTSESPLADDSPEAWERLVTALRPAAMLVCIESRMGPLLREAYTPEDLWQDTLLHVWRDRGRVEWRGIATFRRWVLSVAENRIRNTAGFLSAAKRGGGQPGAVLSRDADDSPAPPPVSSTTPSRVASYREEAVVLRAALDSLPDELRDVVRMRLFEEATVEEVAGALDLGESAVKHRFRKGARLYQGTLNRLLAGG